MQDILEICCGLDVHRDTVVACMLKGSTTDLASKEIRIFNTLLPGLEELKTWIEQESCHHVAMESTGVYWKPVFSVLEDAFSGDMSILVTNAKHMKNVPGRKTDINDSEWIATLLRAGLLRGSFIPKEDVRELRELTRYRKTLVSDVSAQKNRVEKFLQSCGFKLSTFLADVFCVSGRSIIDHLAKHGRISEQDVLLYVKGRAKIKSADIRISVNGTMTKHQREFLTLLLKHLDEYSERLKDIDSKIDVALEAFRPQQFNLDSIPGINTVSAAAILGEIGIDMSPFKTADHICSWAGLAPGNNESAGKKKARA
jgi:transposase